MQAISWKATIRAETWDIQDDIQEPRKENRYLASAIGAESRDIKNRLFCQRQEVKFGDHGLGILMSQVLLSQHQEIAFEYALHRCVC